MNFKPGDVVAVDVTGVGRPPIGTLGLVSHAGLDDIANAPSVVVRFESQESCLYSPRDLKLANALPGCFDPQLAAAVKPKELLQTTRDVTLPSGQVLPAGRLVVVQQFPPPTFGMVSVQYLGPPSFTIPLGWARDYWDSRITNAIPTIGAAAPAVKHCPIKTCAAENDFDVKTCWRCGGAV